MSGWASGLYVGRVFHRRLRPRAHRLNHSIFQMLIDLDELPVLDRRLRLFSCDGFNLFSFRERDHGDGSGDLRTWARAQLAQARVDVGGPVRLLCIPRVLGHAFNPISVYFCHGCDDALTGIIYQVNNTFGDRHSYVIPVRQGGDALIRQQCDKRLHVSPFMDMAMVYRFIIRPPGDGVMIRVDGDDASGPLMTTAFTGRRVELSDRALLGAFVGLPVMTLGVVAGIGWGALRLRLKGLRYRPRPPAPDQDSTIVTARQTG